MSIIIYNSRSAEFSLTDDPKAFLLNLADRDDVYVSSVHPVTKILDASDTFEMLGGDSCTSNFFCAALKFCELLNSNVFQLWQSSPEILVRANAYEVKFREYYSSDFETCAETGERYLVQQAEAFRDSALDEAIRILTDEMKAREMADAFWPLAHGCNLNNKEK